MTKLVSIIINCHNGQEFLSRCIESVLSQDYLNWEIIFWDNCSSDHSKEIFYRYMKNDSRLNYFHSNELTNLSDARNSAISKTQGQYICFLDVDDYWKKSKISKQIESFKKRNISLVFTNFEVDDNSKKKIKTSFKKKLDNMETTDLLLKRYLVGLSTIMFDKDKIRNSKFNNDYHIIGDFDFVMKNSLTENIFGIGDVLVKIGHHENNETKKKFKLYALERYHWFKKYRNNYKNFKNFINFKDSVYFELAKVCLDEKKFKRFVPFFKKLTILSKTKIFVYYFLKIV
jgi:glycosyltransferase involved in cell wall biosynthesis